MGHPEEYLESHGRGFVDLWPVAPAYRIEDGQVCPLAEGRFLQEGTFHSFKACRTFQPAARTELPSAFAKVATGNEADVLDFVRRYGLLGYAQAWRVEELIGARILEAEMTGAPLAEREHDDRESLLRGDPLSWIVAQAQTVQLALNLLGRLEDDAALRAFLATLKVMPDSYSYRAAHRGYLSPKQWNATARDRPARDVALHLIETLINPNLTGVSRVLVVEHQDTGRPGFSSLFGRRTLLDAIYWHLADAAIAGWVRPCADPRCGAFFVATSRKVKFCPPPRGYYAADDEREPVSLCMNRHKQRTYRARTDARHRRSAPRRRPR